MEVRGCVRMSVTEPSQVGEARREVVRLAQMLGFDETEAGRVALVTTEAATNLVKHSPRGGEMLVRRIALGEHRGLEILVLDRGAGIGNLAESMRDGVSTAGTSGTGLGAMLRQSDQFEVWSRPEQGAAILARLWSPKTPGQPTGGPLSLATVQLPHPGEEVCGDAWSFTEDSGRILVMVADGLGHGSGAAEAGRAAVQAFRAAIPAGPADALERLHQALRPTRGAAIAVADVRPELRTVRFAGVGNIAAQIVTPESHRALVSHNGIVGHQLHKVQEFEYAWPAGALLVMHSDGLGSGWDLARYPGLFMRDPALIAGVLYRDFCRGRDDVTVVVARDAAPSPAPE